MKQVKKKKNWNKKNKLAEGFFFYNKEWDFL